MKPLRKHFAKSKYFVGLFDKFSFQVIYSLLGKFRPSKVICGRRGASLATSIFYSAKVCMS